MSARIVAFILQRAAQHRERAAALTDAKDWKPEAIAASELERLASDIAAGKHELYEAPPTDDGPPAPKAPPPGVPWGGERST